MYKIIPNNEQSEYSYTQLREQFNGKWLYLVHAEFSDSHGLIKATPVVVADSELEGIEEGIYKPYQSSDFGRKADADFTNMCMAIPSVLWSERI
jgi:hypothetical protein